MTENNIESQQFRYKIRFFISIRFTSVETTAFLLIANSTLILLFTLPKKQYMSCELLELQST